MSFPRKTAGQLILPNLFVPGAGKSATTSLHDYLNQHPAIYMSALKEPQFFSHDRNYALGLESYAKLFVGGQSCPVRGESSPVYMVSQKAMERIHRDIDNPKFIFILRNPVDRAYSHYWWLRARGYEKKTFREAFLYDMHNEPIPEMCSEMKTSKFYFQIGCYGKWLARYLDTFSKKDILTVITEKLKSVPLQTLNVCAAFLELHPFTNIEGRTSNKTIVFKYPNLIRSWMNMGGTYRKMLAERLPSFVVEPVRRVRKRTALRLMEIQEPLPVMSQEDRRWVANYYERDVNNLRELTGLSYQEWSSDFPEGG